MHYLTVLYDTYLKQLPLCYYAIPEFNNWQLEFNGRDSEKKHISLVILDRYSCVLGYLLTL